jgi:choline-glycine betaine transporter
MNALRSAMIIGALPFSVVMALMTIAMLRALITDSQRSKPESN